MISPQNKKKTQFRIWLSPDYLKLNFSEDIRIYEASSIIKLAVTTTEM